MSDSFWLYDDSSSDTLILDSTVQEVSIGGADRDYKVIDYAGAPGGQIRGFGVIGPRKLRVGRKEKAESGDINFFNSRRENLIEWFSKPRYKNIWLYIRNGEDDTTVRTRAYPQQISDDKFKFLRITDMKSFDLLLPDGVFQNISASTGTLAITGSTTQQQALTNNGTWETPIELKFTPTGNETLFQVELSDQFGIRLEKNDFTAGQQIVYNTLDGSMTIGGLDVLPSQFLTAGTVFNIPPGACTLDIKCSGAGTFAWSYNERYI